MENSTTPARKLIAEDQCIVVLDTSPVRDIAHSDIVPTWVETFSQMAKSGYSFSLSDNAFAELISQHASGAISDAGFEKMLAAIEIFLNPRALVLMGKKDIMGMIGELPDTGWSETEALEMASRSWQCLKAAPKLSPDERISAAEELEIERQDWRGAFPDFSSDYDNWLEGLPESERKPLDPYNHPYLDKQFAALTSTSRLSHPNLAERMDLQIRYLWRQFVRTRQSTSPYNPESRKKRNDGIDFDLYRYLMLPAFFVATDGGFFEGIKDIKSPQGSWIWKPEVLAEAWLRGSNPRPIWVPRS